MIETADQSNFGSQKTEAFSAQLSITQAILLHLLPGVLITVAFMLLGPWVNKNHLPPLLTLLIPILFVLIPFELGTLYYLGFRRNKKLSLEGIVLNRKPLRRRDYFLLTPVPLVWAIAVFMSMSRVDQAILQSLFGWLPDWFQIARFTSSDYSQPALVATFLFALLINGLAGPVVEELYFRGFLLPRIEHLKGWAPLVNVALFSLYHFFSPWQNLTRILAFLPMAYVVRWKQNIYLGMLAHCLLNTGYCILSAQLFFG